MRFLAVWLLHQKFILGVLAVVVDNEGRVLLLDHVYRSEFPWALPSGWVRRGEQLEEAITREIREEVRLEVKDVTLLRIHLDPSVPRVDITFLARPAAPGARPVPSDPEIRGAGFYFLQTTPRPLRADQLSLAEEGLRRLGFTLPSKS
jgi:ADP-ribose pyrophosphatase YjhB (NUDIX family)